MPIVFRNKGYRFFFFSNEGDPLEPLHIHVRHGEAIAKFWILPEVCLVDSYAMKSSELRELAKTIGNNKEIIERSWNEYFNK